MAAVIGIGIIVFARQSDAPAPAAQLTTTPASAAQPAEIPNPDGQVTDHAGTVAQTAPPAAQTAEAPAPVAHNDSTVAAPSSAAVAAAAKPKVARDRHAANADSTVATTTTTTVTRTERPLDRTEKPVVAAATARVDSAATGDPAALPAAPNLIASIDTAKSVDPVALPAAATGMPTELQDLAKAAEPVASDSSISNAVKSVLAADNASTGVGIKVTTSNGVVALTGALANQDAIDHVKGVAARVKDVKSVDVSAMTITST